MKIEEFKKIKTGTQVCFKNIEKIKTNIMYFNFVENNYFQTDKKKVLHATKKIMRFF